MTLGVLPDHSLTPDDTPPRAALARQKIALVCDYYLPRIGGIERHLALLAQHLGAAGHDVTVITPTKGAAPDLPGVRVERMRAHLLPGAEMIWAPPAFRRLGAVIRAGNYDVVHVHSSIISPTAFAALYHAQQAGLPTVSTTHSILGVFTPWFRRLHRWCRWGDWPIVYSTVSDRVAREIRPIIAPHPVMILPNAVDPERWRVTPQPPAGEIAIACVMRLVPRKRGAVMLHALRAACDRLPPGTRVSLHLAGDGPQRGGLQHMARRLGLGESVHFLGSRTPAEIKALLARCHFFVLPSLLEAFGIAALEARAAGLPVIAMRESGVSEFIVDGRDGLLPTTDAELAAAIGRLCTDHALRERLAEHNRRTPVGCTWDRVLAAHLATYEAARQRVRPLQRRSAR